MDQVFKGFSSSFSPMQTRSPPPTPCSTQALGVTDGLWAGTSPGGAELWMLLGWGSENWHIHFTAGKVLAGVRLDPRSALRASPRSILPGTRT